MTLEVVFRRAAQAEFDAAALRYDMQRPGLGAQFVSEISRAVDLAATYPERFSIRHADIRRVPARRFPYAVHLPVHSQVGHPNRDGTEHQRNHYHLQHIDEQRADKFSDIKPSLRGCGLFLKHGEPQAKQNACKCAEKNLGVK